MTRLVDIEGIGQTYASKLKSAGVRSLENLLKQGHNKKGRQSIAKTSSVSEKLILEWVNRADLSRIKGVSTQYADMLEQAGVDTIPELAQRNAQNLVAKMAEVNAVKKLVRKLPSEKQVEGWINQAKSLPRMVTH